MFMTSFSGAQSVSEAELKLICVKMYALSKAGLNLDSFLLTFIIFDISSKKNFLLFLRVL